MGRYVLRTGRRLWGHRDWGEAAFTFAQLGWGKQRALVLPLLELWATVGGALPDKFRQLRAARANLPHPLVVRRGLVLLRLQRGVFLVQRGHLLLEELGVLHLINAKLLLTCSLQLLGGTGEPGFLRNLGCEGETFIQVGRARRGLIGCGLQNLARKIALRLCGLLQPTEQLPLLANVPLSLCSLGFFTKPLLTHQRSAALTLGLRFFFRACRGSGGGCASAHATTADCQAQQALHQRTGSATVCCGFPDLLNDCLVWLVDALGDQVLCDLRCRFLCALFATSDQCTLDCGGCACFDGVCKTAQDSQGGEHLSRTHHCAQPGGEAAVTCFCFTFFSAATGFTSPSANTQRSASGNPGSAKRCSGKERYGGANGFAKLTADGFFVARTSFKRLTRRGGGSFDGFAGGFFGLFGQECGRAHCSALGKADGPGHQPLEKLLDVAANGGFFGCCRGRSRGG